MKAKRQRKIIELISKLDIETQEELANRLNNEGFTVTQATVSRDIRELNLTKVPAKNGKQKYSVSGNMTSMPGSKYIRVLRDDVIFTEIAENILVIKTVPGMAMAVGAAIDAMNIKNMVGCIAGDDTVFCVIKKAEYSSEIKKYLESYMN